jgi:Xaa-Pro aminopeptidase
MSSIFSKRLEQVRNKFSAWQVDGLLVSNLTNCRWLSGFSGSAGTLLITVDKAILAADSRYWEQAADQAPDFELFCSNRTAQDVVRFITSAAVNSIGFEANFVTVQQAHELQAIEGISWQPLIQAIEPLRMVKTADELAIIEAAAAITDAAMAQLPQFLTPGMKESELAWRLEKYMREHGASGMAFPPIVAFGPNSARPHHTPGDNQLHMGDIVLVDMGAKLNGYCSDLTRTFYYGKKSDPKFLEIFDIVLAANTAAVEMIEAGVNSRDAHMTAYTIIQDAGYGEYFGHGLGHGLGLDIHEMPFLSLTRKPQVLENNCALTIEPGIYMPGWGGVRIEDLVQVTENGTKMLSHAIKKPALITPDGRI